LDIAICRDRNARGSSPSTSLAPLSNQGCPALNLQPRYNIAPTTTIDVIIPRGANRLELTPMRWA
jgi:putative SOS response-associated peptidase YedK